jgi:hypothetical protein
MSSSFNGIPVRRVLSFDMGLLKNLIAGIIIIY